MAVRPTLPTALSTSDASAPSRASEYLDAYAIALGNGMMGFAGEGSYFHASNATLGTAIAGHAAPVIADGDGKALLHVFNGTTKSLYPDYLFLEVTAVGTAGSIHYTTIYIDAKGSTALASGGTTISPVCTNSGQSVPSGLVVTFGAAVTSGMSSSRKVGQQIVREVIPVVQDTVLMKFGGSNGGYHSSLVTSGTNNNHSVQHFAAICVAPGGNLNISQIRPSQSAAASYQFSFGFVLR